MSNENTSLEKTDQGGNSLTKRESDVGFSLQPKNLQEAMKICEYLASSSVIPKQYRGNSADILVAINYGQEFGLKPLQSLNSVGVINGSPGLYGDAPLALCKRSPEFEFILEDNEAFAYARDKVKGWGHLKDVNKNDTSICVVKRKGEPPVVREFSKEDVSQAKLGNVHKTYPKVMRRYRARSQALRAAFPDVLKGFQQAEILEETHQMIEEGHYEDVTEYGDEEAPEQPEQRETLDFEGDQNGKRETEESSSDHTTGRQEILEQVNELGKKMYGSNWFQKSKAYAADVNPEAKTLLDLDAEQMGTLLETLKQDTKAEV
jgi:hypothetical protein